MFRLSPELKEEIKRRIKENDCTITSYIECLIHQDLEENPKPEEEVKPKRRFIIR